LVFGLSPIELVVIFLVVTFGSTIQGAIGYGMALVVSPVLLLIDPRMIPAPLTVASILLVILVIVRDRQAVDFFGLKWAMLGLILGIIAGTFILSRFSSDYFAIIFAILILVAVAISATGVHFPPRKPILTSAGIIAGLMGILTTTPGPALALVYQDAPGRQLRATLSGFFIVGTIFALISLSTIGRFGLQEVMLALILIPGILIGYLLSSRITSIVDKGYTRPLVLTIATLSAIFILVSQLL
jgi:uncharacterized membrane protein YfcA